MKYRSVFSVVAGLVILASASLLASPASATTPGFMAIPGSARSSTDAVIGNFNSGKMSVEVVLAPRNQAQINALLAQFYAPGRNNKQWLPRGRYNALFGPTSAQINAVAAYLRSNGLTIQRSNSPFFVRASGSSQAVASAFKTSLHTFRNRSGITYFSNVAPAQMPASLAPGIRGVIGLQNTVRNKSQYVRAPHVNRHGASPAVASCQTLYPTVAQLVNAVVNGVGFDFGYGAGPGCTGLTPSQLNGIYGAPTPNGGSTQGAGMNLAVFELAAYQQSDIVTYTQTFYGGSYTPPLRDIAVDGGPLDPICPEGDTCPGPPYNGDVEVDADIEAQLAIAPAAANLYVYMAPNDFTGQTELDNYAQIAEDDLADSISSSWAICEQDAGADYASVENDIFTAMALQGQSMFGAQGDTGAFGCIRSDGTTGLAVIDPPAQPWVTSVGGTSFPTFNPAGNLNPVYPQTGSEVGWNVQALCNTGSTGGVPGLSWCAITGAGGGGNSMFWGRPSYQNIGFGINNPFTVFSTGPDGTNCIIANAGTPCREIPDVSANADEFTPYAEYCTGSSATPGTGCGTPAEGWFGIGGTSLSSPLWSAIIGDRVANFEGRVGNANPLLYLLSRINGRGYFHDISGIGQTPNNNGAFPATPGYDLFTGLGTPRMGAIITGQPTH
jgi:subtilase family serine protease